MGRTIIVTPPLLHRYRELPDCLFLILATFTVYWGITTHDFVFLMMGNAFQRNGQTDEAIVHYLEVLRIKPDYAGARFNLEKIDG